jgi:methionyl-tRNA synthetase
MKELVVAAPRKKAVKKRSAKKAETSRTAKASALKKRTKKAGKRVVKRTRKAAKKPAGRAQKKPSKKSLKKTTPAKRRATSRKTSTAAKTSPAGKRGKRAAVRKAPVAARPSIPAAKNSYYITTAISYPNGAPHIGHAYEAIATDALARFQRLDGKDVFFLTGTDEHGLKMIQTAQKENMRPSELAARNAAQFKEMDQRLNVSFDRFIRTSEEQHHRSVQEIWKRMADNGDIYLDNYAGWYSVRDEAYYAEDETVVGEDDVRRGPQGTPVEWVEENSYFFKLSAYQDKLLALYESQPDFIGPDSRRNEVVSFVKSGLRDLSISRTTFDWGVRVPGNPEHVMYVWVDALANYITGVGFPDENDPNWRYWPADVHIIGKDIIRFHAVYWPAFLMSAGIPVQKRVFAHGFLFNRGEKMSKSVGNVVDPFNLADQYGVDQMRYFFLREVPFGQDGSYNHEAIIARINADLANDLGNLAQRSLSMIAKQYEGVLPEPGEFSDNDKAILTQADGMVSLARTAMATQQIHQALNAIWAVVAEANRYFAGEAPWALAKTDPKRQATVLYVTAEVVRQVAILAQPAMPAASAKLLDILGIPDKIEARNFAALATPIKPGSALPAPAPVFPRYIEPVA